VTNPAKYDVHAPQGQFLSGPSEDSEEKRHPVSLRSG
jgi:hypothetical protein